MILFAMFIYKQLSSIEETCLWPIKYNNWLNLIMLTLKLLNII